MSVTNVKLSQLRLSPLNARKGKALNIEALAADIAAHGLINNLAVYEEEGAFAVFAGGRRYRALKKLAKAKTIAADFLVPVTIRTKEEAVELSLAENTARESMHPADAIAAYGALRDELGLEPVDIAARFGVAVDYVRRIQKLSALAPACIAALRKDDIGMDAAQALTLTDDHALQVRLLKDHQGHAYSIRKALTGTKLSIGSGLFVFVGEAAYIEAGGTFTRDLFAKEGEGYADNPELVEALATAKMESHVEALRAAAWGKVEYDWHRPDWFYSRNRFYGDTETLDSEAKAAHLVFVTLAHDGTIEETIFKPKEQRGQSSEGKAASPWSAALTQDLTSVRTVAIQNAVAGNPDLAKDILLSTLASQLLAGEYVHDGALTFTAKLSQVEAKPELADSLPVTGPDLSEVAGDADHEFSLQRIAVMAPEDKDRLLAVLVASMIDGVLSHGSTAPRRMEQVNAIAAAAGLDVAHGWQPTPDLFLRAGKKTTLSILEDVLGSDVAANLASLKKADLAIAAADRLQGRGWQPPQFGIISSIECIGHYRPVVSTADALSESPLAS